MTEKKPRDEELQAKARKVALETLKADHQALEVSSSSSDTPQDKEGQ